VHDGRCIANARQRCNAYFRGVQENLEQIEHVPTRRQIAHLLQDVPIAINLGHYTRSRFSPTAGWRHKKGIDSCRFSPVAPLNRRFCGHNRSKRADIGQQKVDSALIRPTGSAEYDTDNRLVEGESLK